MRAASALSRVAATGWRLGRRRFCSYPPHTVLGMPALSPTMTQGNLAAWKKAEGDEIAVADVVAEVETDKATVDFESQDEGFLAKILIPAGCVRDRCPRATARRATKERRTKR